MPSYEVVEHSVEGSGERHFFRVAIWFDRRTRTPDAFEEFLIHPGPDDDPLGPMIGLIENRVADIAATGEASSPFSPAELKEFKMRPPKKNLVEQLVAQEMRGLKSDVRRGDLSSA